VKRAVAAPFVPAFVRTLWMVIKEELVEDDLYASVAQTFSERADALALFVVSLSVTDEDF
jgi:hypothetical protein